MPPKQNICKEFEKNVVSVNGLSSNSASPTDTWFIEYNEGVTYKGKPIVKSFFKIFIDTEYAMTQTHASIEYQKFFNTHLLTYALGYELNVYKLIIKPLIELQICPHFIEFLDSGNRCTWENLFHILNKKVRDEKNKLLSSTHIVRNLNRNIFYMLANIPGRQAIQDCSISHLQKEIEKVSDMLKTFRFNIIINKETENSEKFDPWIRKPGITPKDFWEVLFQICHACYAMSLQKMNHNDLHSGNVFVREYTEPQTNVYFVNTKAFSMSTRYFCYIYDFDRAYATSLGENILLNSELCTKGSQCNIYIENKDIIKILCYIYNLANDPIIKRSILELVTPNVENQSDLTHVYSVRSCFLQDDSELSKHPRWYTKFNSTFDILLNISTKFNRSAEEHRNNCINNDNVYYLSNTFFNRDGSINIERFNDYKKAPTLYINKLKGKIDSGNVRKYRSTNRRLKNKKYNHKSKHKSNLKSKRKSKSKSNRK